MAEAAAVVGLISAIVQLVDFSTKVVHRLQEFASATCDIPGSFQSIEVQLPLFIDTLQRVQSQAGAGQISDTAAQALRPIVESSLAHVQTLTKVLDKVVPTSGTSSFQKRLLALKSLAYDEKVEKHLHQLQSNIQLLVFHQTTHHSDISEEMRQILSRLTLPSTVSAPQYSFGLQLGMAPPIEDGTFVGREAELQQLREWLSPQRTPQNQRVMAIVGMGGLGKTQLSLAFAKRHHYEYSSVFWLNARDEVSLKESFMVIWLNVFGVGHSPSVGSVTDEERRVQQIRQWLSHEDNGRWLLLFDNYDDPKLPSVKSATAFNIRQYFPHRSQGSILITTRSHRLTFAKTLILRKLDDIEQSLTILSNRAGRNIQADPDAYRLATRLDGLPLALTTAATYLRQTTVTIREYLDAYEECWHDLRDDAEELAEYEDRTLFTTWNLSLARVRVQDPEAAELLRLLAYFGAQNIQYELFEAADVSDIPCLAMLVNNKRRFERAMARLCDYSLVENWEGSYSLHPCVHDWTLQELNEEISKKHYLLALHCVATRVKLEAERDYWQSNQALVHHAIRYEHKCLLNFNDKEDFGLDYFDDLGRLGILWWMQIEYSKAEQMYQRALAGKEKVVGPDHTSTLDTVNYLGLLYCDQGKLEEAEQMYRRALAGQEKALGLNHTSTLNTVGNLGILYSTQGKLEEAEQMFRRALAGQEKALGPDHTSTLGIINHLGYLYYQQDKLEEAEQVYRRALAGREKALGPDHTSTLDTINDLGILYNKQGKREEAEQMYQRALVSYEKALGPDHISTLIAVHNLGGLYSDQGKLEEAEQIYLRALVGKEKALGPDHTLTLSTIHSLGRLYSDQGKLEEAEQMYLQALAGYEKALGPDHTSTLTTVYSLGRLYSDQGKLEEAEQMYLRALTGEEKAVGPDHTLTLTTVYYLGHLYSDQGKLEEAEQMYLRALAGEEKTLGPDHTSTLTTVYYLGRLYNDQGKLEEAEQIYQRALAGYEKALGPDHTSTLTIVYDLGRLYSDRGKLEEAEQIYQRALAGYEKALGPDHTSTLTTVYYLGHLYSDRGKLEEAEQMYRRALAGEEKALGPDHASTLTTVYYLGRLYSDQGKLEEAEQMYLRALAGEEKALGPDHTSTLTTVYDLSRLYSDQGKLEEAEQMYQRWQAGRRHSDPTTLDAHASTDR